jgi:hypothetical protein
LSYLGPRRWNRSLHMCAQDIQITRIEQYDKSDAMFDKTE